MIKDSPEYIEKHGRTNDIVLGIIMFWMLTSINKDRYNLIYFNEKMDRFLDAQSTQEQMERYKKEMTVSIRDTIKDIKTIRKVIDVIVDIYGTEDLDYQLHMYGPTEDSSGDYWLKGREECMKTFGTNKEIFSIICSSNGVSITMSDELDFLNYDSFKELYRYYNLEKLIIDDAN